MSESAVTLTLTLTVTGLQWCHTAAPRRPKKVRHKDAEKDVARIAALRQRRSVVDKFALAPVAWANT